MTTRCDEQSGGGPRERTAYEVETDEAVSMAVVDAVASASGRSPIVGDDTDALDPLGETVDPEALDRVFESAATDGRDGVSVAFDYCGHRITVKGATTVCVTVE